MEDITNVIIVLIALIVIFLVLREFINWYWKINERLKLQKESLEIQKTSLETLLKIYEQNGGSVNWDNYYGNGEVEN